MESIEPNLSWMFAYKALIWKPQLVSLKQKAAAWCLDFILLLDNQSGDPTVVC